MKAHIYASNGKIFFTDENVSQQTFVGFQDVLKMSLRHVLKTSSARLQRKNFSSSKTSWRCLQATSHDVLKTSWKTKNCYTKSDLKISWRHFLKTSWRHILKTSWRHVLKVCLEEMSWRHVLKTCLKDILKTCLEDVLVLKTPLRRLKDKQLAISVSHKSKYVRVSNKSLFHKPIPDEYTANPK